MRIAFIHPFLFRFPRGIERFLFRLANALARCGVEVEILTWRWPAPVVIDDLDPAVRLRVLPAPRYFAAKCIAPLYAYHLLRRSYDFVWIFFAGYGEAEALSLASLARELPYGVSLHYPFNLVPHRYREFRRLGCIRNARRIVSTSRYVAEGARRAFGRGSDIIRTGVDTSLFRHGPEEREAARRTLGLRPDDSVVLTVAALEGRKGIHHVLNALPEVRKARPRLKYLVVGEGPARAELQARVSQLGLDEVVRLAGSTANVLPYYQAADVFALLSHGEAAPIAPLEAMAAELPLVVARQPPFDEIVGEGCGVLVAEDKPAEVAREIGLFLSEGGRGRAAGEAGRRRVCREFTWERIARQYLECSH
jgi:glycosyltransferase involved in cell wall biosynthesis